MLLPPPRWLGGEFYVVKPARSLCGALEKCFVVRGIVLTPQEPRRETLVERVIELPSLLG